MRRRSFNRSLAAGLAALAVPSFSKANTSCKKKKRLLKAKRLQAGDTIGLISPGSTASDESFEKAVNNLKGLGFKLKYAKNVRAKYGYLAGTDQQRLDDLHSMFADQEVDGIWCVRGGYGCGRLLPHIDYKLIRKNPKVLIGYSDITALIQAIFVKTGLVCFHGPVGTSDFTDYSLGQIKSILMQPRKEHLIPFYNNEKAKEDDTFKYEVIRAGVARGKLAGGNLSLISSLVGTPFDWDVKGKLLFIEDVGEKPYRIDRMLTQVLQSQNLKQAAGIILGVFADCKAKDLDNSLSLMDTLKGQFSDLGIPVAYGFSFGHISNQCVFPVGIEAEFDTSKQIVRLLDSAVI